MSKLRDVVLVATAFVVAMNMTGHIVKADHYDDRNMPEQPDGYAFMTTGTSSASATSGVILTFPVIEPEAPAHEVKPRPAFIKKLP